MTEIINYHDDIVPLNKASLCGGTTSTSACSEPNSQYIVTFLIISPH